MSLENNIMEAMKVAMKNKDSGALEALRAVKSAILLAKTQSGTKKELTEGEETALLQKLVKQRKESAAIYAEQGRNDLASPELAQAEIIAGFLPKQLSDEELTTMVEEAIAKTGAQSVKDMGAVIGMVVKTAAGRADGKTIADTVKQKLT